MLCASVFALMGLVTDLPFALGPGTWWEYAETYTIDLDGVDASTDERTRFQVRRGRRGTLYIHQEGGADPVSGPVEIGRDSARLTPWTGEQALPLPLTPGRDAPSGGEAGVLWTVEGWEEVDVPAGRFRALRCAWRSYLNVSLLWIAPGVGVVREEQGTPGRRPEIARVLLRWSGNPRPTRLTH